MSERERLAADTRRLAWLADATVGPARITRFSTVSTPHPTIAETRVRPPLGLWRRGLSAARVLGHRITLLHAMHPGSTARRATGRAPMAVQPPR